MPGEVLTVQEDDFVVNKVQIGKTLSLVEVSNLDTIASHLHVVQDTLALVIKALERARLSRDVRQDWESIFLSVGLSHCLFTGLEPMSTGTLSLSGTRKVFVFLGDHSSLLYSKSCEIGNWRSHVRESIHVTAASTKDLFGKRMEKRNRFRTCSTIRSWAIM